MPSTTLLVNGKLNRLRRARQKSYRTTKSLARQRRNQRKELDSEI